MEMERRGVVHQPWGQVRDGARMGHVVALHEIAEQHRAPVLLVDSDAQRAIQSRHLREPAPLPVPLERLAHEQAPPRRKRIAGVEALEVQELPEGEGEDLPGQRPAAHLGRDLPRQHARRRARDVHLAPLGPQQAVDERLPSGNALDLVEEAVDRLGVLLLRMQGEVGVRDGARALVPQMAEAVVEEVHVQDVVARHAAVEQFLHLLEQERRLAGAPRTDADGRLPRHGRHVDPARHPGRESGLAEARPTGKTSSQFRAAPSLPPAGRRAARGRQGELLSLRPVVACNYDCVMWRSSRRLR